VDRDEAKCCTYNANDDCKIDLTSADVPNVYSDCTGSSTCTEQVTWMQTTGQCPQNVMSFTNYMCIDYECLPTTDELGFCDAAGTTLTSTTAYIADDNYPAGISHTDCCACVFTASANSATITIEVIEMTLYDVTTTCNQSILIESGTNTYTYNCTHNTDYTIQTLLTVTSTATVTLKNDATSVGNGRVWMRATGRSF
ncbi:hypothetical protein MAR_013490, partial [Mya arenaria]